jgi:hypothetical protein
MVELSVVNLVELGILGIGVVLALQQLRDIKETRQAQLFMQIYNHLRDEKFQNYLIELRQWDRITYDEIQEMHDKNPDLPEMMAKMNYVTSFFEGVGVLVDEGFLDIKLVFNLMATFLFNYWINMRPLVNEFRTRANRPEIWRHTEFLYQELMKLYVLEYGHEYSPDMRVHVGKSV